MKSINVLFVYPNRETVLRIPLAGSILCAYIQEAGHNVRVFDSTFIGSDFKTDIKYSEDKGTVKKSGIENYIGELDHRPLDELARELVKDFPPDLIAVTMIERNYTATTSILKSLKKFTDAPVLAGGILPTIAPDVVMDIPYVDVICVGEGEGALVDICNAIAEGKPTNHIPNLWLKENGNVVKNPLRALVDINTLPHQNWDFFDKRHIYRAYKGKVRRNGSFEFARGCMKMCSFCVAPNLKNAQSGIGSYHRFKDSDRVIEEIVNKLKKYDLNLIHFGDTDFLSGMKMNVLEKFTKLYKQKVDLPFLIQTGAETISDDKMKMLKEAGLDNISIGVESGSDRIRRDIIKKYVSKKKIVEAFNLGRKYKIRMTANYMFGVPSESEESIRETIEFNKLLNPPAIAAFFFTPFLGTELYDISLEKGYIYSFDPQANLHKESPLNMPHLPPSRISELMQGFIDDYNSYKDEY